MLQKLRRGAVRALAALGLLMVVVTVTPATEWWVRALAGPRRRPAGEVLIVLGGDRYDTRTLGVSSYWRCVYAAEAYRERRFSRVVVSGGGSSEVPIAVTLADCLVHFGVRSDAITLEPKSGSTRENALFVARLLPAAVNRPVLLTSDAHMFRASRAFRKAGLEVERWPAIDTERLAIHPLSRWLAFVRLCEETARIGYYFIRGWI